MKVIEEIKLYSAPEDKVILLWLLERYHWASQWQFVAKCDFVRYGVESYKAYRVWKPTIEGAAIYNQLHDAQ